MCLPCACALAVYSSAFHFAGDCALVLTRCCEQASRELTITIDRQLHFGFGELPLTLTCFLLCDLLGKLSPQLLLQADWAAKAGMEMQLADSDYRDKVDFHKLLRAKHGLPPK